ncbi:hypothetical protein DO021_09695 [Desulfobacter hydrogenophilus]|uniref:Lipoprotein n=1 Tax=Desulfobacter hydrogenophilus TaxID=2291 RepID=A0A328FGP6_9BACT|nr:hypothetical protein [Desulfobacter hydrogenophilus]NDY72201.1 hypothetical protein [Desulfobacter hydrogenophilus]QBH15118.1 hypothetical protein EYB58_20645 [Desulfobacter hydrogenophilus]RAM02207.1 hypothetical protein DO021_09695 [Desulfobacter hydrogenophilus]
MNRSTILALFMLVSSTFLFSGCVVPADGYYSDPGYRSNVMVVPALPYTVNLYQRPYYNYHGYYYFYSNQRWYYSRAKGGRWIALPRTHWPRDTRWKGRHFHNDHRDHKYDRHDKPQSKKPKYQPQKDPRRSDKYRQKNDSLRKDSRHNEKNQLKKYPGKRAEEPRQHDRKKVKQERNDRNQRKMGPPQNKNRKDDKNRKDNKKCTEEEIRLRKPGCERR